MSAEQSHPSPGALCPPDALPRHVAIIMDGNGRWATRRRSPRFAGHRAGVNAVREVVQVYGHPDGSWGCERMVYAYGYPLSSDSDPADSERVKEYRRNGELMWGTWYAGLGSKPETNAAADSK